MTSPSNSRSKATQSIAGLSLHEQTFCSRSKTSRLTFLGTERQLAAGYSIKMSHSARKPTTTSENAKRRSDLLFLRKRFDAQTPAQPFDPLALAPNSQLPLWKLAHQVVWQGHLKPDAAPKEASDAED